MAKSQPKDQFLASALRALVPSGVLQSVRGTATGHVDENMCHFVARDAALSIEGAVPVAGWTFEDLRRHRPLELYLTFDYHSVVRLPDGTLVCPSTPAGDAIHFIVDPLRPFDYEARIPRNLAVFSNHRIAGARSTAAMPFTLTWAVPFGDNFLYSNRACHARWVPFGHNNPFEFARSVGLDPRSVVDMGFVSDLGSVAAELGLQFDRESDIEILNAAREAMHRIVRG